MKWIIVEVTQWIYEKSIKFNSLRDIDTLKKASRSCFNLCLNPAVSRRKSTPWFMYPLNIIKIDYTLKLLLIDVI
jgi:hypothetical protein